MKSLQLAITLLPFLVVQTSAGQKQLSTFMSGIVCDKEVQVTQYLRSESVYTNYTSVQPKTAGCKFIREEVDVEWKALFRYDDGEVSAIITEMEMPHYGRQYGFVNFKSPPDDEI